MATTREAVKYLLRYAHFQAERMLIPNGNYGEGFWMPAAAVERLVGAGVGKKRD